MSSSVSVAATPGMVFHIPLALCIPNNYGIGFSEMVLVTETGCEVLTKLPRELRVRVGRVMIGNITGKEALVAALSKQFCCSVPHH